MKNINGKIDVFIFSSGFEKRSMKLASKLKPENLKNVIGFHLDDTYKISTHHLEEISKFIPKVEILVYPKNKPLETNELFVKKINDVLTLIGRKKKIKVLIDITSFTREVLLILLNVIFHKFPRINSQILLSHTPAKSYSENDENLWLTRGVREIRSVVGYSGILYPSKKMLLIMLTGFEEERSEIIIESFEPTSIILGKPTKSDSINEELSSISVNKYDSIKAKFEELIIEEFEFPCTKLNETKEIINRLYYKYKDSFNIIVSPLNNKISTVAAGISSLENPEIQICYASANQYNIESEHVACDYFLVNDFFENISTK